MIADLEKIDALLGDLEKMRDRLRQVGSEVAVSVEVMVRNLGAVRHIEQQIRLLSINTSIQCRRLGDEGRALRVIAEELRSLAAETLRSAAAVMSGLGEADRLAQALTQAQASGSTGGVSTAGERANAALRLIRAVVGRLENHVQAIARTGPDCVRLLREAAGTASGAEQLGGTWSRVREKIADLAADISTSEDDRLDLEFVAGLRAAYTMESERRLHDSLFDGADEGLLQEAQDGSEKWIL